jgi:predicted CXXCH cytochrome family protein
MERWPSPATVLGNFNNVTIEFKGMEVDSLKGGKERITAAVRLATEGGKYFFTLLDKDSLVNNQTYEVAKTLGGKWDQHYETKIGENFYPTPMRWSVRDREWLTGGFRPEEWFLGDGTPDGLPRRPDQLLINRSAEAKCAGCHMTGYAPEFDKEAKRWKGAGAGAELGIACEKCHGPGSLHVAEAQAAAGQPAATKPGKILHPLKDLNAQQQNQLCAQCHGRNTNKQDREIAFPVGFLPGDTNIQDHIFFWSYSGDPNPDHSRYFWPNDWAKRNRQQWQDFTKSTHFTKTSVTCLSCHTFHGQWAESQLRLPRERLCAECHKGAGLAKRPNVEMFTGSPMEKAGTTCVDCHMPKIGYRTTATPSVRQHWDTSSHTFMVAAPLLTFQYGVRNSCDQCHQPGGKSVLTLPPEAAQSILQGLQAQIRTLLDQAQQAITKAEAALERASRPRGAGRTASAAAALGKAKGNVSFVLLDGSMGFHNVQKAKTLLEEAKALAESVGGAVPKK